ncbi:hypothetical protein CMK22_20215 [Candidatus Poribacteria bacterium]|nr:hypothetical protein [Candidatus Poribacteria bacterium]|tara:strand:+ start:555 stop:1031 length:477 start_codon:yes stop_codon:yes gene_type:complete
MMTNRVGTVLITAFISSIISGVLWAKMLSISTTLAGISSITVGIIVGLSVLLTGRKRKTSYGLIASAYAIIGLTLGKFLDVRWNTFQRIQRHLMDQYELSAEQAEPMAQAQFGGYSTWELMADQTARWDILLYAAAAYFAFRIVFVRFLHNVIKTEED